MREQLLQVRREHISVEDEGRIDAALVARRIDVNELIVPRRPQCIELVGHSFEREAVLDLAHAEQIRAGTSLHLNDDRRELRDLLVEQGLSPAPEVVLHSVGDPRLAPRKPFGREQVFKVPERDEIGHTCAPSFLALRPVCESSSWSLRLLSDAIVAREFVQGPPLCENASDPQQARGLDRHGSVQDILDVASRVASITVDDEELAAGQVFPAEAHAEGHCAGIHVELDKAADEQAGCRRVRETIREEPGGEFTVRRDRPMRARRRARQQIAGWGQSRPEYDASFRWPS